MNISQQDARNSLEQIHTVAGQTRRAIASSYASPLLILWGVIFVTAYMGTHFFRAWASHIWMVLDAIGVIGTFLICWRQFRLAQPTKISPAEKIGWRLFWFWALLFIYIFFWLNVVSPLSGLQLNAFLVTIIMFAYIAKGLWLESYFLVWLGLAVTGITLLGLYVIPTGYYCLWMAPMGGGALLGTGLYIRFRWR